LQDGFGASLAVVGNNRIVAGAPRNNFTETQSGRAYLLSTNGAWVATFNNPTPAAYDYFGQSVAAVGAEHVVIGAWSDDTGALHAGAAYLFRTNGALVNTFTNPTPEVDDEFGYAIAGLGNDRVIIGARYDDTVGANAGALFVQHQWQLAGDLRRSHQRPHRQSRLVGRGARR